MSTITFILEIVSFALPVLAAAGLIAFKLISKKTFSNASALKMLTVVFGAIAVLQFSPLVGMIDYSLFPFMTSTGLLKSIPIPEYYFTVILFAMSMLLRPTVWLFCLTYDVFTGDNDDKKNFLNTIGEFARIVVELTIIVLVIYCIRNLLYLVLDITIEGFFASLFLVTGVLEAIVIKLAIVVAYFFLRRVLIPNSK